MYTRKIIVALALLLVCLVVLLSASYAWIAMSTRPEVNGIATNIGANGSLEIALLSAESFKDPGTIQTQIGDSAVNQDATKSNLSWGNVVDLDGESYGLDQISMYPARLNMTVAESEIIVGSNMLTYAEYGLDGRISGFYDQTASGIYTGGEFMFHTAQQEYGVRGIGTVTNLTPQQSALAKARTAVPAYGNAAVRTVASAWDEYGKDLMTIWYKRYALGYETKEQLGYDDGDIKAISGASERVIESLDYCEAMLKQYILGYAATQISDTDQFSSLETLLQGMGLYQALELLPVEVPSELRTLVQFLQYKRGVAQNIVLGCGLLRGGSYSWSQLESFVFELLPKDDVYLNENVMASEEAFAYMTGVNELTVYGSNSLLTSAILYGGTYSKIFDFDTNVTVTVVTVMDKAYPEPICDKLAASLEGEKPAGDEVAEAGKLQDICGFAVDLAFRCNEKANLLLQTDPEIRVDNGSQGEQLQGGGSSMKFTSDELDTDQIVKLMDGIRIAFLDDQSRLLATAKLNTSNYVESKDGVSAPLHLYSWEISDTGVVCTLERVAKNGIILALPQSTPVVVTVVVWLDGDSVDNSFASVSGMSISGSLNLQFSTDAELVASSQGIKEG